MDSLLRVLYVDDDSNDRTMFGIMAEKSETVEFWLYTVANAQEAIDYLEGNGQYSDRSLFQLPEIVVSDLGMPGGGGIELLEWRRSSGKFAQLPIVILSGSLRSADLQSAKALGAVVVLEKTGEISKWETTLKEIYAIGLRNRQKRSSSPA